MEFAGRSVLVIEDEPPLASAYANSLRSMGFSVDVCNDATGARDALWRKSYDLVWVDLALDGDEAEFEGHRLIAEIRSANEGTQVVVVSAHNKVSDFRHAIIKMGAHDFIAKSEIDMLSDMQAQLPTIRSLVASSSVSDPADLSVALTAFFEKDEVAVQTSKLVSFLSINADSLNKTLNNIYNSSKPLFRPIEAENIFDLKQSTGRAVGNFWSKKFGSAVEIVLGSKESSVASSEGRDRVIYSRDKPSNAVVYLVDHERKNYRS